MTLWPAGDEDDVAEEADVETGAISVTGRTTAREIGERVEVEWGLSATPGLEWVEVFQFAEVGERDGPVDWRQGGGPDVVGATVRWFVPTAELDGADREVSRRLEVANRRCAP
jgi:hypothetical protein